MGVLPGIVWLFYFLKKDKEPEPKRLILLVFIMGCLSVFLLVAVVKLTNLPSAMAMLGLVIVSTLVFAFLEEIVKFSAAYFTIRKNKEFDEPVDAMIYSITAALGFATLENLFIVHKLVYVEGELLNMALSVIFFRFFGATLLHSLAGAVIGYFWGKGLAKQQAIFIAITKGIVLATILHFLFNYLVIKLNVFYACAFLILPAIIILFAFEKLKRYDIIQT